MDKYLMWIHYERLHNHNKAKHSKTVCIFLGIFCMQAQWYNACRKYISPGWFWHGDLPNSRLKSFVFARFILTVMALVLVCWWIWLYYLLLVAKHFFIPESYLTFSVLVFRKLVSLVVICFRSLRQSVQSPVVGRIYLLYQMIIVCIRSNSQNMHDLCCFCFLRYLGHIIC